MGGVVVVGETQDEKERLARLEEKVDQILKKIEEKTYNEKIIDERVRALEIKVGVIMTVGAGAWAVILILIGKVFGTLWG